MLELLAEHRPTCKLCVESPHEPFLNREGNVEQRQLSALGG